MTLLLVFIVSILTNFFILYHGFALGFTLSIFIHLAFAIYTLKKNNRPFDAQTLIKLGIIVLLSGIYVFRNVMVFKIISLFLFPLLFASLYVPIRLTKKAPLISNMFCVIFRPFGYIHFFTQDTIKKICHGRDEIKYIFYGILITIPFLFLVLPLLLSSDRVLLEFFLQVNYSISSNLGFRFFFILFVSSFLYGHFIAEERGIYFPYVHSNSDVNVEATKSHITTTTFLIVINSLYLFYVYIQVRYLFLSSGTLPQGVSYAQYARSGFFQLLIVTLLNVAAILILETLHVQRHPVHRFLKELTLMCTFVMCLSAFYRMSLYEKAFGLTLLRLLVYMFLLFLMGFIFLTCIYLLTYNQKILLTIIGYSVIFYLGSAYYNIEEHVVQRNITRYHETGDIDYAYLVNLSPDAYPAIETFFQSTPIPTTYGDQNTFIYIQSSIQEHLDTRTWQEFTFIHYP